MASAVGQLSLASHVEVRQVEHSLSVRFAPPEAKSVRAVVSFAVGAETKLSVETK